MINVNDVYRVVLAILNKEQRGLLTPDQFNRLARQAQLDILDSTFSDYLRLSARIPKSMYYSEAGDPLELVRQKLAVMQKTAAVIVTTGTGPLPADYYKLFNVTTTGGLTEVEKISKEFYAYYGSSKLTAPTTAYPCYYQEGLNIKVLPTSITSVDIDYIRKPADPKWDYTGGTGAAYTYDATGSTQFELHPASEYDLVIKILALAGVIVKDPSIFEMARAEQADSFTKDNV